MRKIFQPEFTLFATESASFLMHGYIVHFLGSYGNYFRRNFQKFYCTTTNFFTYTSIHKDKSSAWSFFVVFFEILCVTAVEES